MKLPLRLAFVVTMTRGTRLGKQAGIHAMAEIENLELCHSHEKKREAGPGRGFSSAFLVHLQFSTPSFLRAPALSVVRTVFDLLTTGRHQDHCAPLVRLIHQIGGGLLAGWQWHHYKKCGDLWRKFYDILIERHNCTQSMTNLKVWTLGPELCDVLLNSL